MKKSLRVIVFSLCIAMFAVSSVMLIRSGINYIQGASSYNAAREFAGIIPTEEIVEEPIPLEEIPQEPITVQLPDFFEINDEIEIGDSEVDETNEQYAAIDAEDPYMVSLAQLDLKALRDINPDVIGWITIPDTKLDYPIMKGEDNQFYLENTWDRQPNSAGSIFLECQNSADFSDFNTIIYGHRMKDGSMFASLKHYKSQEHWKEHPYVYIVDDGGVHRYEIFAAYEAGVRSYTYCIGFTEERKTAFLNSCMERSVLDTGIIPSDSDQILTLSTCTGTGYDTRWVVQARLSTNE